MTDEKLLELAREQFKRAEDAFSETRQLQRDDYRFAHGSPDNNWQWPDRDYKQRETDQRPALTVNKLPLHIAQVTNDARQNRPSIKIRPVDDKADVDTAEVFNGIIRHIEANSDADTAYDMAIDQSAIHGEGYVRVLTDFVDKESFDQEIFIKPIADPFAVYCDPDAVMPEASDAQWWFVEAWYGKEEFKAKWPKAAPVSWDAIAQMSPGWVQNEKIRVAEYWHKEQYEYTLSLWSDGSITKDNEGNRPAMEKPVRTRKVVADKIYCCTLSPDKVLEKKEWAGTFFPFVRVVGNWAMIDGKIVQSGIIRNSKDAQRMYNLWVSQEAEFLGKWTNIPYIAPAEAVEGFEQDWRNSNRSSLPVLYWNHTDEDGNPIPAPQRVQPPVAPSGLIQAKLGASEDIKATTGQFDASLGQKSNETSGRAILARQREGDTATYHYIDNLSKAIRQLGRILVDLVPKIYDTQRVARILGEDDSPENVQLNPEQDVAKQEVRNEETGEIETIYNLGVGKYDVVSTVGPNFTTKRQEALEAMTQLTQANPQLWSVIGDLMVKNMDWPGADDMAKRLKAILLPEVQQMEETDEEIPPQVMAQMQQMNQGMEQAGQFIQQLQAELQKVVQENQALKQDKSLEAAKIQLEARKLEISEAESVAKIQQMQAPEQVPEVPDTVTPEIIKLKVQGENQQSIEQMKIESNERIALFKLAAELIAKSSEPQEQPSADPAETISNVESLMVQIENMARIMAAPKQIIKDEFGNVVGVQSVIQESA